jgi:hypothetical protein
MTQAASAEVHASSAGRSEAELARLIDTYMSQEAAALPRLLAATSDDVEFVRTRTGGWGVRRGGVTLDSTYDPAGQAAALMADQDLSETELLVVIGCGGGELPRAAYEASKEFSTNIVVFEPELAVLRGMFERVEGLEEMDPRRLQFFTLPDALKLFMAGTYRGVNSVTVIAPPAYRRLYPGAVSSLTETLQQGMGLAVVTHNTMVSRGREWVRNSLNNLHYKTRFPSIHALKDKFAGIPAIVVAAGPSLDKNIHLLAEARSDVVLLSVTTALRAVLRAGAKPHFVTSLEAANVSAQIEGLEEEMKEMMLVLDEAGHSSLFELPTAGKFTFLEASPAYLAFAHKVTGEPQEGLSCGASVANATFSVAQLLGCDPIILIGQDLAYTGGRVYAAETVFSELSFETEEGDSIGTVTDPTGIKQRILDESDSDLKEVQARRHIDKVKAWDGEGEVYTSSDFTLFKVWFQHMALHLTQNMGKTLINATEGGAYIEGFEHITLREALARHGVPLPQGRSDAIIAEAHAGAPRLTPERCARALQIAAMDYQSLNVTTERAMARLDRVVAALDDHGPSSQHFANAMATFELAELQVRDQSFENPLLEPYISGRVTTILQDRGWLKSAAELSSKWHTHLDQSRMILASVSEATLDLVEEIARHPDGGAPTAG